MKANDKSQKLNKAKYAELGKAFQTYIKLCREANVIDYDDQIYLLLELFEKRPNVLTEVRAKYSFIMVDEYQDTNRMQAALVEAIAGKPANLLVVGDDDQSIYGWRGATLANILEFKKKYPKTTEVSLTENYRSTIRILDAAYNLIQHNNPERLEVKLGINKRLKTSRKGQDPSLQQFNSLEAELSWITQDIRSRITSGTKPSEIAILARRNSTLKQLSGYLHFEGVDHVLVGQRYELYHEPIVRTILEALKAIVDTDDSLALYHTLTSPLFNLPVDIVGEWASNARKEHESLHNMVTNKAALKQLANWRGLSATLTVGQLVYEVLDSSGYKDQLYKQAGNDSMAATAVSRLSELFSTLKQFEQIATVPSAVQYMQSLPALQAAGDTGEDATLDLSNSVVNLLTVHKAKGLEWSVVYIVDCTEGSFPLRQIYRGIRLPETLSNEESQADSQMSEERRLMYVAMTRAKDNLILSYSLRHGLGAPRKPSRFLVETFGEIINNSSSMVQNQGSAKRFPSPGPFDLPELPLPSHMLKGKELWLTVSQIQKYLECPLDFYYRYILRVPQPASPSQEYGSLMHELLQNINEALMSGKKLDLNNLKKKLNTSWSKHGYLSAIQSDRAKNVAHETLQRIFDKWQDQPRVPLTVEQSFRFRLSEAKLCVSGRFDAVLQTKSGVEIVDYKTTASVDTPEKAKQRATGSQQLALYALAWQKLHDELPDLVTLDYVDTGVRGSVRKTQRGIDGLISKLQVAADNLRAKKFNPGQNHTFCIHPEL